MPKVLIVTAVIVCACAIFVLFLIKRSPEGHEDSEGFHRGPKAEPMESSKSGLPPVKSRGPTASNPAAGKK